jgi:hypothetical protein
MAGRAPPTDRALVREVWVHDVDLKFGALNDRSATRPRIVKRGGVSHVAARPARPSPAGGARSAPRGPAGTTFQVAHSVIVVPWLRADLDTIPRELSAVRARDIGVAYRRALQYLSGGSFSPNALVIGSFRGSGIDPESSGRCVRAERLCYAPVHVFSPAGSQLGGAVFHCDIPSVPGVGAVADRRGRPVPRVRQSTSPARWGVEAVAVSRFQSGVGRRR